jgi:hypothetical protein
LWFTRILLNCCFDRLTHLGSLQHHPSTTDSSAVAPTQREGNPCLAKWIALELSSV